MQIMIKSGHTVAHGMTAELLYHVNIATNVRFLDLSKQMELFPKISITIS